MEATEAEDGFADELAVGGATPGWELAVDA